MTWIITNLCDFSIYINNINIEILPGEQYMKTINTFDTVQILSKNGCIEFTNEYNQMVSITELGSIKGDIKNKDNDPTYISIAKKDIESKSEDRKKIKEDITNILDSLMISIDENDMSLSPQAYKLYNALNARTELCKERILSYLE